ncbi:hypothetical protein ACLMJK_003691 [Lecanora helva]
MVSPLFGWSAGDVVQSIKIITKLCRAFKEEGGSASQFSETVAFLDGFIGVLDSIKDFAGSSSNAKYSAEINTQTKLIDGPYKEFQAYLLRFKPSLGAGSSKSFLRRSPRKVQWAMNELSEVSGKVIRFKKAVSDPLLCIGLLLALRSIQSMEEVISAISRLRDGQDFKTLLDAALNDIRLRVGYLEDQMRNISESANDHGNDLRAQGDSLLRLTRCLSKKEQDMRSLISQENERNQQHRLSQNAKKLDKVQAEQCRLVLATTDGQKVRPADIHHKVEESLSKVAQVVEAMQQSVNDASRSNNVANAAEWLKTFARQLVFSGITSAMTGEVVLLANQDKPVNKLPKAQAGRLRTHNRVEESSCTPTVSEIRKSPSSTDLGHSQNITRTTQTPSKASTAELPISNGRPITRPFLSSKWSADNKKDHNKDNRKGNKKDSKKDNRVQETFKSSQHNDSLVRHTGGKKPNLDQLLE